MLSTNYRKINFQKCHFVLSCNISTANFEGVGKSKCFIDRQIKTKKNDKVKSIKMNRSLFNNYLFYNIDAKLFFTSCIKKLCPLTVYIQGTRIPLLLVLTGAPIILT